VYILANVINCLVLESVWCCWRRIPV